ncbi:MAG: YheU family protein [Pseudomonadales bacterium]|nr:YheU family protein [Pseudomonadales bacterium]NIX08439.1 YheU family protein [Pseudomonadales bacterium]
MKVPLAELSEEALTGVIESFVLREGTDYGLRDFTLAEKCALVREQLESGDAVIYFDPVTRSIDIRTVG